MEDFVIINDDIDDFVMIQEEELVSDTILISAIFNNLHDILIPEAIKGSNMFVKDVKEVKNIGNFEKVLASELIKMSKKLKPITTKKVEDNNKSELNWFSEKILYMGKHLQSSIISTSSTNDWS
jgi:hypothetical protein